MAPPCLFAIVAFNPLLDAFPQASLWILRVAVGTVSNVDLPLNEVLGAVVKATGAELLEGIGTEVPSTIKTDSFPAFGEGATEKQIQSFKELRGTAYEALCKFMQEAEPSQPPPRRCWPRCRSRSSTPPPTPTTLSWEDSMVQVRNRNGRWAWVLNDNEKAYRARQAEAARPHSS